MVALALSLIMALTEMDCRATADDYDPEECVGVFQSIMNDCEMVPDHCAIASWASDYAPGDEPNICDQY